MLTTTAPQQPWRRDARDDQQALGSAEGGAEREVMAEVLLYHGAHRTQPLQTARRHGIACEGSHARDRQIEQP